MYYNVSNTNYLLFFPPFPDLLEGPVVDVDAVSCFLVLPWCLGTISATFNISCFPAKQTRQKWKHKIFNSHFLINLTMFTTKKISSSKNSKTRNEAAIAVNRDWKGNWEYEIDLNQSLGLLNSEEFFCLNLEKNFLPNYVANSFPAFLSLITSSHIYSVIPFDFSQLMNSILSN